MAKGVLWNGKNYIIPQAASRVDSSALTRTPLSGANRLAILGTMTGLIAPGTMKKISNASLALSLLHPDSEEARLAAQLVFDPAPGSEIQGASEVYLVPVNPATQASAEFSGVLTLTSYLFGATANQVKAKIEDGTIKGKKVTVSYGTNSEVFDNLGKESFSIAYKGIGSAATLSINPGEATITTTVTDGEEGSNLNIDLSVHTTIQALVDAINTSDVYEATVETGSPNDLSSELDAVTDQSITPEFTATSNLQAIVDGINAGSAYVSASRVAGAVQAPENAAWTYLAGGADGVTTNAEWQAAFDILKTADMDLILPLTGDKSIHAMADSHADYMSGPNGKSERRVFVGGTTQSWNSESGRSVAISELKSAVKALNSDRTMHCGLGSKHYDPNGALKLYPAYITAAMYVGIAAGGSPVLPLTRKYLRCYGLEVELRTSEIQELLEGNVAVPIPDMVQGAGYVVSRQLTTWLQSDDLYRIEFSVGRGADYIAREVRRRHELLIGKPGTEGLDQTIVNITNAVLEMAKRDGYIRNFDPEKTTLRVDGTIRYVDYAAEPILPVNWIFSTYYLVPTTFSIGL